MTVVQGELTYPVIGFPAWMDQRVTIDPRFVASVVEEVRSGSEKENVAIIRLGCGKEYVVPDDNRTVRKEIWIGKRIGAQAPAGDGLVILTEADLARTSMKRRSRRDPADLAKETLAVGDDALVPDVLAAVREAFPAADGRVNGFHLTAGEEVEAGAWRVMVHLCHPRDREQNWANSFTQKPWPCSAEERLAFKARIVESVAGFLRGGPGSERHVIRAVIVCEDHFEKAVEFATAAELDAFIRGFNAGTNAYGGGSSGVYTLDDLEQLEADFKANGFTHDRAAIAAVRAHLAPPEQGEK